MSDFKKYNIKYSKSFFLCWLNYKLFDLRIMFVLIFYLRFNIRLFGTFEQCYIIEIFKKARIKFDKYFYIIEEGQLIYFRFCNGNVQYHAQRHIRVLK